MNYGFICEIWIKKCDLRELDIVMRFSDVESSGSCPFTTSSSLEHEVCSVSQGEPQLRFLTHSAVATNQAKYFNSHLLCRGNFIMAESSFESGHTVLQLGIVNFARFFRFPALLTLEYANELQKPKEPFTSPYPRSCSVS